MKKQAYLIITGIIFVTVAGLSTAKAQTNGNPKIVANIPFAFSIGEEFMPAGEYTVRCVNPESPAKVLQIRSQNGNRSALVRTNSVIGRTQDKARLVFYRYGDQFFFAQAWLPGDDTGMQAPRSQSEKVRKLAREKRATETVMARRQ